MNIHRNQRLWTALGAYAVLGVIALVRLQGTVRYAVLILLAGLLAKTVIADRAGWTSRHQTGPDGAGLERADDANVQNGSRVPGRE